MLAVAPPLFCLGFLAVRWLGPGGDRQRIGVTSASFYGQAVLEPSFKRSRLFFKADLKLQVITFAYNCKIHQVLVHLQDYVPHHCCLIPLYFNILPKVALILLEFISHPLLATLGTICLLSETCMFLIKLSKCKRAACGYMCLASCREEFPRFFVFYHVSLHSCYG